MPSSPPQSRHLDPLLPWLVVLTLSRQWLPQRVTHPTGRDELADMPWRPPQRSQITCKPTRGVDAQHRHPQPQSTCHCQLTLRRGVGVRGQSHACVSRRRTGSDDNHHQPPSHLLRPHRPPRPTRLRLVESRFVPPTGREAGCGCSPPSSGRLWAGSVQPSPCLPAGRHGHWGGLCTHLALMGRHPELWLRGLAVAACAAARAG